MTDPKASTIPAPPLTETSSLPPEPDTGNYRDAAEMTRAYLAVCSAQEKIELALLHLQGRIEGHAVDLAQTQSFEQQALATLETLVDAQEQQGQSVAMLVNRVEALEITQTDILKVMRELTAAVNVALATMKDQTAELGHLRQENARLLSLVPPIADIVSAQEGE